MVSGTGIYNSGTTEDCPSLSVKWKNGGISSPVKWHHCKSPNSTTKIIKMKTSLSSTPKHLRVQSSINYYVWCYVLSTCIRIYFIDKVECPIWNCIFKLHKDGLFLQLLFCKNLCFSCQTMNNFSVTLDFIENCSRKFTINIVPYYNKFCFNFDIIIYVPMNDANKIYIDMFYTISTRLIVSSHGPESAKLLVVVC